MGAPAAAGRPVIALVALAAWAAPDGVEVAGYLDVGAFVATGDGVAYRLHDEGAGYFAPWWAPQDRTRLPAWIFWGDPWANAVNSHGESADLGNEYVNPLERYDRIASGGRPTFLVNALAPAILAHHGDVSAVAELLLQPGNGELGALGDVVAVDAAYVEWTPLDDADLHVSFGKVESSFGYEYRYRRAPDRHGITPSLVARYTVGTPVGLKARGSLARGHLPFALGVTNGGTFSEHFGHFADDVDANGAPTVSGRIGGYTERPFRLQGGISGQYGVQDGQSDPDVRGHQVGADARFDTSVLSVRAEIVRTFQPGRGFDDADRLRARGGFVQVHGWVWPWFAPLARYDWRRALLFTHDNLYITQVSRITVGARFDVSADVALKVEYLGLIERTGPKIRDDVATTAVVFQF